MGIILKLKRGTTVKNNSYTGLDGEVTVDSDKDVLVVHDGGTPGGSPLATEAQIAAKADKVSGATNGNLAALDANGNLTDGGSKAADFAAAATAQTKVITDTGSYFATDTVEAALQETGASLAAHTSQLNQIMSTLTVENEAWEVI